MRTSASGRDSKSLPPAIIFGFRSKTSQRYEIEPPKRLRDLLWIPAKLKTGPSFRSRELGEILVPAVSPLSSQHPDDEVRLGRVTEWCEDEAGEVAPFGQKDTVVDGEEVPVLEIRN